MDHASLEVLSVGRDEQIADVVSRVLDSIDGPEKHYLLLVGPRGSGKTHLVAIAYHRILAQLAESADTDRAKIALLNEEEWGVASYLDFLVRILRALAQDSRELEAQIEKVYAKFAADPRTADNFAEELLRSFVGDRTLVLICENLIDLFRGLGDEGQKRWRSFIQESNFWSIVATTPALFAAVAMQKHPFYGFFTIRELDNLNFDGALEFLIKKAEHDGEADLAEFLRTPIGRARVRAIHHLAGGNHRAYVVLFDFLDKQSLDDLIDPFMHMVDDLTPYYQDQMRQLAPAQRKIVEYLCHASHPMQIKDISASCLMSHQTATKQLGELESAGFVQKMRIGRDTYCELSEPLMRICIEVKDNRTEHFRLFVEFLRHWFSRRELERRIAMLAHDVQHSRNLDEVHLKEAMLECRTDRSEPFLKALDAEGKRCLQNDDYAGLESIHSTLTRDRGLASDFYWLMHALNELGKDESVVDVGRRALERYSDDDRIHFQIALGYWGLEDVERAFTHIERAIELDPEDDAYLCISSTLLSELGRFEESIRHAQKGLELDPTHWHGYDQIMESLVALDRLDDAAEVATKLEKQSPDEPEAMVVVSRFYSSRGEFGRALQYIDRALELDPDCGMAHHGKGWISFRTSNFADAAEHLIIAAKHFPRSVSIHCRLSDTFAALGRYEDAARAAEKLLRLAPDHTHAHYVRGDALVELGKIEEGIAELIKFLDSSDLVGTIRAASLLESLGEYDAAIQLHTHAIELESEDPRGWIGIAQTLIKLGQVGDARGAADTARANGGDPIKVGLLFLQLDASVAPLSQAVRRLIADTESIDDLLQEGEFADAFAMALSISAQKFGPFHLVSGIRALIDAIPDIADRNILGPILSDFISKINDGVEGTVEDWTTSMQDLRNTLGEYSECQIPLNMIEATILYAKTDSDRYLLKLPLEQRQLLEEAMGHQISS